MRRILLLVLFVSCPALFAQTGPWKNNRFADQYRKMTLSELRDEMAQEVPTRRGFVAEAIAEHKVEAWPTLKEALRDKAWRARACALTALDMLIPKARSAAAKAEVSVLISRMPGVVETVTAALDDSHFWVRCRAAGVLGNIGEPAASAGNALTKLCGDEHPWVRERAAYSLQSIGRAAVQTQLHGVINTLNKRRTSFGDSRFVFGILRGEKGLQDSKQRRELAEALIHFIAHPGEGMWSNNLSAAIGILIDLEPERKRLVELFAKILTDPSYEQRGNPRVSVCKAMPKLGDEAKALAPSLRKAIARENELIAKGRTSKKNSILGPLEEALGKISETTSPAEE